MNKSLKMLTALALLCLGSSAFAYRWGFTNYTKRTLVIKLGLQGTDADFFNIVQPGRRTEFDWGWGNARAGFCLSYIYIGPYKWRASMENFPGTNSKKLPIEDPNDPKSGYDQKRIIKAIDDRGPWFYALGQQMIGEPTIIFLKDKAWGNFDSKIKKAAETLTKNIVRVGEKGAAMAAGAASGGATTAASKAIGATKEAIAAAETTTSSESGDTTVSETALAETNNTIAEALPIESKLAQEGESMSEDAAGIIGSMITLVKTGKCMSRNFDVVERKGVITLITKL